MNLVTEIGEAGKMARSESMSAAELREEQLRQIREAKAQDVINKAKSTGVSSAGQPVVGWADSRTPTVTGNSGLQGGAPRTDSLTWANQFQRNDSQLQALPATTIGANQSRYNDIQKWGGQRAADLQQWGSDRYKDVTQWGKDRYSFLNGSNAPAQSGITQGVLNDIFANPFTGGFSFNGGFNNFPIGGAPSIGTLAQGGQNHAQMWQENALRGFQRVSPFVASGTRSFTDYGQGSRRPYIGGAGGDITKDFVAGGKYSSYKAGSDPTLDQFSFASAFR